MRRDYYRKRFRVFLEKYKQSGASLPNPPAFCKKRGKNFIHWICINNNILANLTVCTLPCCPAAWRPF